jgi:ComEC/Rec2-related protein
MIDRGWKFYPALKLLLPYAAGLMLATVTSLPVELLLAALAIALIALAVVIHYQRNELWLAIMLVVLIAGALSGVVRLPSELDGLQELSLSRAELIGRVVSMPIIRSSRIDLLVECDSLLVRNSVAHPGTHVLVRIYDSTIAPSRVPLYGDHVSLIGAVTIPGHAANPGGFDYGAYLRSRDIELTMSVGNARSIDIFRRGDMTWWESGIEAIRQAARDFADQYVGGEEGDILRGLLTGELEYVDMPTREAFARTGTIHLLAVSGQNAIVIILALFVVISWIPNRWVQLPVYVGALVVYAAVAGGSPSIVRAVVMASVYKLVTTIGRIQRPLNTLAFAALLLLILRPGDLFDVGFQLSFASVTGIIMVVTPLSGAIAERWPRLRRRAVLFGGIQLLLISIGTQLFTLPLLLYHFGYVSIVAPIVNIVVVPLASLALGAGVAGVVFMALPLLPGWFGGAAYMLLWCVEWLVHGAAAVVTPLLEPGTIGLVAATVIMAMSIYLALSRAVAQALLRLTAWSLALFSVMIFDHALDPLRSDGARDLYILRASNGIAVAAIEHDTLMLYASGPDAVDSGMVRFIADPLGRRLGVTARRVINIDSAETEGEKELILINYEGKEYAMRSLPVIVASTRRRPLGFVRLGGEQLLYAPLRSRLAEAMVLRYDGGWREVEWR